MNIDEFDTDELPKVTDKQLKFVVEYYRNKKNRVLAYREAYNSSGKYATIWKEATKLINSPALSPYIAYYDKKYKEYAEKEIEYSLQDAVNEIDMMIDCAMDGDKNGVPNVAVALKGVELKCKLKGYGKDNLYVSGDVTVMPDIVLNGKKFNFEVGEQTKNDAIIGNETTSDFG